jgi:hypothetical protein
MPTALHERFVTRSRSVVSRSVAGETLVVPVRGKVGDLASIYSFNGTGSLIWRLLDSPRTPTDLIEAIEREYDVGREQAQKDVTHFLEDMLSVGLLEFHSGVAPVKTDMINTEVTTEMTGLAITATEMDRQAALERAGSHSQ